MNQTRKHALLIELLQDRKTSRRFAERKIDHQLVERIKKATQLSASCFNNQPWRFIFLYEEKALQKGRNALKEGNNWAKAAPLLVVGYSRPELDCQTRDGRDYYLFDLGLACQLIMLQATEFNLVARPMAGFYPEKLKSSFNFTNNDKIMVMFAIGYDADENKHKDEQPKRERNQLNDNFFDNRL